MSYKKRQETVRVQVRIDGELETDLRILYSVWKRNFNTTTRAGVSWNDFLEGIMTKYVSDRSQTVLAVREGMSREGE
jgi:hypothetical protein